MKIYSVVCIISLCGFFASCSNDGQNAEITDIDGESLTSVAATSPPTTFDVTDDPRATYEQYTKEPENKDLFDSDEPKDRYIAYTKTRNLVYTTPEVDSAFESFNNYLHSSYQQDVINHLEEYKTKNGFRVYPDGLTDEHNLGKYLVAPVSVEGELLETQLAIFTDCEIVYATVIDTEGNVIDESYGRNGLLVEMRFEEGKWRVVNQQTLLPYEKGVTECDFSEFDLGE